MNKKRIISKNFQFLLDIGFELSLYNAVNIVYVYTFRKDNAKVTISEDIREKYINIALRNGKGKVLLEIAYAGIMENEDLTGLSELVISLKEIYKISRNKRFTNKYFIRIIELYSNFLKANLSKLID
jgi:hypothetical protein